jgi:uncharacterized membrane protein YqjE
MDDSSPASSGITDSLADLGHSLIGTVQERIELVSIELQEEKWRLIRHVIWGSAAVFAGVMTLSFATLTIVYLFWESARLGVLAGFTLFYGAGLAWILVWLRRSFTETQPFEASIKLLKEDRECIRKQN